MTWAVRAEAQICVGEWSVLSVSFIETKSCARTLCLACAVCLECQCVAAVLMHEVNYLFLFAKNRRGRLSLPSPFLLLIWCTFSSQCPSCKRRWLHRLVWTSRRCETDFLSWWKSCYKDFTRIAVPTSSVLDMLEELRPSWSRPYLSPILLVYRLFCWMCVRGELGLSVGCVEVQAV